VTIGIVLSSLGSYVECRRRAVNSKTKPTDLVC